MLGIICALPTEAKCFKKQDLPIQQIIKVNSNAFLYISGIGQDNAEKATHKLITHGATQLVSWGIAAGLSPDLAAGDLVLANQIINLAGDRYIIDPLMHQNWINYLTGHVNVKVGTIMHQKEILTKRSNKSELFTNHQALAVDMESYGIAAIAKQLQLPLLVIRVIVDPHHMTLPRIATRAINSFGKIKPKQFAWNLLRYPNDWSKLVNLAQYFSAAQQTLAIVAKVGELID